MRRLPTTSSWIFILGCLAFCAGQALAQDFRPTIRLQPGTIGLEEMAVLEIEIHGANTRGLHFDANFELDNFEVRSGPNHTMSVQIINGVPSTSRTLTWHLQPRAVGPARVHSVRLQVGPKQIGLDNQAIKVQQEIPENRRRGRRRPDPLGSLLGNDPFEQLLNRRRRAPTQRAAQPKVFLRAAVDNRNPYVGQQVLYTLYLYTQTDISSVQPESLPAFKGFWVKEVPQPERFEQEAVELEGQQITRVVLLQRALFPLRAGGLDIEAVSTHLVATMGGSRGFFSRPEEITRESNALSLEVRPLPDAPPGFTGAIGDLRLEASLEPREVEVGSATTLTLTLSGRGHLQGVDTPLLPEIENLRPFPPQERSSEKLRRRRVYGTRTWSFVLIPEAPGDIQIPPLEIPYFDPAKGSFQTAMAPVPSLRIQGNVQLPQGTADQLSLHPIRTAALPAMGSGRAASANWQTWLFATPWALALGLILARRRGLGGEKGQAKVVLRSRLDQAAAEDRPRETAAAIEEAWRGYLSSRWQIPAGAASPTWGKLLAEKGAPAAAADELMQLADDLHYLRYAPKLSSTDGMRRELLERSHRLIRTLG